jgi:hypothetical protein
MRATMNFILSLLFERPGSSAASGHARWTTPPSDASSLGGVVSPRYFFVAMRALSCSSTLA